MKSYRVNEIFYSLQGEGCFTGVPSLFIRMSGCNRACDFCDTDHSGSTPMTLDEIIECVKRCPARHIVLTGGEPALQVDDALVEALHQQGCYVQIETNGSLPVCAGIDWVTCSPKDPPLLIDRVDELKVVYQGRDVEALADMFEASVYALQPCSGQNIPQTIEYCLSHPRWRLSLQTHKMLDIR